MEKLIRTTVTICALYFFCIKKNFWLGSFFVGIMLVKEIIEYKKNKNEKPTFVIAWSILLILTLVLAFLWNEK